MVRVRVRVTVRVRVRVTVRVRVRVTIRVRVGVGVRVRARVRVPVAMRAHSTARIAGTSVPKLVRGRVSGQRLGIPQARVGGKG